VELVSGWGRGYRMIPSARTGWGGSNLSARDAAVKVIARASMLRSPVMKAWHVGRAPSATSSSFVDRSRHSCGEASRHRSAGTCCALRFCKVTYRC
jgi:hypothetical protein